MPKIRDKSCVFQKLNCRCVFKFSKNANAIPYSSTVQTSKLKAKRSFDLKASFILLWLFVAQNSLGRRVLRFLLAMGPESPVEIFSYIYLRVYFLFYPRAPSFPRTQQVFWKCSIIEIYLTWDGWQQMLLHVACMRARKQCRVRTHIFALERCLRPKKNRRRKYRGSCKI